MSRDETVYHSDINSRGWDITDTTPADEALEMLAYRMKNYVTVSLYNKNGLKYSSTSSYRADAFHALYEILENRININKIDEDSRDSVENIVKSWWLRKEKPNRSIEIIEFSAN